MKSSGVEWIGDIPAEWEIIKIGSQYTERRTKVSDNDYPPLSVTMKGILPQLATAAKTDAHDDRKLVCKGDFAINSRSDRRGSCGISPYDGSVSLINTILCPRDEMNPRYYDWLFHSIMFSDEFYKWGHGIVDDLWTTNWQDMKKISIPEPSLDEQDAIASFIDRKCAAIDAVIEKTKATIEEYKKLKQSVITEAVTKGIRGDRPMKDSGIEWIGDIPVEWNTKKLKYTSEFKQNKYSTTDGNLNYIGLENIVAWNGQNIATNSVYDREQSLVCEPNDILFGKLRPYLAKVYITPKKQCCSSEFCVISIKEQNTKYMWYQLISHGFIFMVDRSTYGAKMPRVSADYVKEMYIAVPPQNEQKEIVDYLNKKCAEIDLLITKKTNLLTELENYKKSLIYEYVTGKKECSEIIKDTAENTCPCFPAVLNASSPRFAQAVLMSKTLDECGKNTGRVKLEKMLFTIENSIGFNFDTEYVREAAGPLDNSIYDCEGIISKKNKWYIIDKSKRPVSYTATKNKNQYKKYYDRYFAEYDGEINRIIDIFKPYSTDQAEIIATLFAAWNDAIIDGKNFSDEDIVNDVLNNWNDSKKRFSKEVWLRALDTMRKNNLIPKGYGKKTVIKGKTV